MKDMKFMKVKHSLSLKEEAPNLISLAERRASHPNPVSSSYHTLLGKLSF
jgi:hypothetical protein